MSVNVTRKENPATAVALASNQTDRELRIVKSQRTKGSFVFELTDADGDKLGGLRMSESEVREFLDTAIDFIDGDL